MAQCYRNSGSLKNGMAAQAHRTSGSFAPRLFNIFDEPSAGLDNSSVELLKNCICKIAKQSIVIIVTHDENLCSICDVLYEL